MASKGRYPKDHPRAGGYFVLWAKQTLQSDKLKNDHILACFVRVLAVAQLTDYETGRFERAGMPFSALTIAHGAGITGEQFNNLVSLDLIQKETIDGQIFFFIKSWIEHQSPKNGLLDDMRKESHIKPPFNSAPAYSIQHSSGIIHHARNNGDKSKYDSKSKKLDQSKPEEQEVKLDW